MRHHKNKRSLSQSKLKRTKIELITLKHYFQLETINNKPSNYELCNTYDIYLNREFPSTRDYMTVVMPKGRQ